MNIKGAIFDVDGVLLDTMHVWTDAGARYLETLGKEAEPRLGEKLFSMTVDMGAVYLKENYSLSQPLPEIVRGINAVVEDFYFEEAQWKPGAKELLERLTDRKLPIVIASSTAKGYIEAALKRLGGLHYFKEVLSCVELGTSKSEPMIFQRAMEVLGTKPGETWLFEDGLYSVKTAAAAGLQTVGVYDEISAHEQKALKQAANIYVLSLEEFETVEF